MAASRGAETEMKTYIKRQKGLDGIKQLSLLDEAGRSITMLARLDDILCLVSGEFSVGEWEVPFEDFTWLLT